MKLHLPVRLFKFVLSLVTVMPVLSQAAYVKPTSITIPEDHTQVLVDAPEDIFIDDMRNRKFVYLMSKDITFADVSRRPAIGENGSWIFTSASVNNLVSLTFTENNVFLAGAIYGIEPSGSVSMIGNADVCFSNSNSSGGWGGAFFLSDDSSLYLNNNENVSFSQNTIGSVNGGDTITYGGAVFMGKAGAVTMNGNKSVSFTGNSNITLASDEAWGGAICIYSGLIEMNDNESVIFRGNVIAGVEACGGAILGCNYGATTLNIRNNDDVLFEKNAEITEKEYRLRGVYLRWCCVGDVSADFSAPKGKKIEFRDSVCIEPQWSETHLNRDYTDAKGNIIKQTGDIIFTGKYTEAHLNELLTARKAGRKATNAEISNSRTSSINGSLTLYGGRLRIEDGAVLNVENVTVKFGNAPVIQLKNAQLNSSQLTFESGTTLRVQNSASVSGYLTFSNGSNLAFVVPGNDTGKAVLTMESGRISLTGNLKVSVSDSGILRDKNTYVLISGVSKPSHWDEKVAYTLPDSAAASSRLYWEDSSLLFYFEQLSSTWNNSAGNRRWDFTSLNWVDDGNRLLYRNSAAVTFGNGGAGAVTLVGSLSPKSVTVNNSSGYNYTWQGSGKLTGSMKLTKKGTGTLTIKTSNTYTGGTAISGGTVVLGANNALGTGAVTLSNATLNMGGKITPNNLTLTGSSKIQSGTNYRGNFTMNGNLLAGSAISIISGKTANLKKGNVGGTISGAGNTVINGAVTLNGGKIITNKLTISGSGKKLTANASGLVMNKNASDIGLSNGGNLTSAGAITARNITLSNKATLNAKNSASRNITLGGSLKATASTVNLHGNLTAGNLVLNNATLRDNGSSARAVTVTNSTSLSNNAKLNIKGYLRSKNLTLNKSSLRQHSNNRGVALTGTLTMNSGSTLTAQGALSAANMKLSGGTINLTSTSFNTIKVSGTLTLSSAIDLNLGCKLTTGKNYTLIRFNKTNLTSRNNLAKLLGLTGSGATLTLRSTGIILKVTNAAAWNKYLSANKTAFNKAASVVNAITPAAEETEVVEIAADTATTVAAEPAYDRSSADMLVQSNRGVVNASRAFTDTLGNRASNSTAFGANDNSAVWLSAMGASSRLSSDGAAAGSDYNLFGAAVGMEQQLTEKSSLGLAIGESYGKVNSFTSARTKQDTLHTALYGQYSAVERSRDAVLLDWSAAYGRTESKWQGTEWEQKSVQLDARATWAHQLTADTTVSGFAGMQYFASESADIAPGIKSGSVQNLRGEIGVGIGHMATVKTRVYGELSFVGDMVRHNPTADMGGVRERGANPGRAGINFSVGGTHALNDRWSVNANYNLELMERANSHSANIGTSYKF